MSYFHDCERGVVDDLLCGKSCHALRMDNQARVAVLAYRTMTCSSAAILLGTPGEDDVYRIVPYLCGGKVSGSAVLYRHSRISCSFDVLVSS
jgi:hypothetical protein